MACSNLNPQFKIKSTLNAFPFHWFSKKPERLLKDGFTVLLHDSTAQEAAACSSAVSSACAVLGTPWTFSSLFHVSLGCCTEGEILHCPASLHSSCCQREVLFCILVQLQKELLSGAVRHRNPDLVSQMPFCHPAGEFSGWQLWAGGSTLLRNT